MSTGPSQEAGDGQLMTGNPLGGRSPLRPAPRRARRDDNSPAGRYPWPTSERV